MGRKEEEKREKIRVRGVRKEEEKREKMRVRGVRKKKKEGKNVG